MFSCSSLLGHLTHYITAAAAACRGEQEFFKLSNKALSLFGQNRDPVDFGEGTSFHWSQTVLLSQAMKCVCVCVGGEGVGEIHVWTV